MTATFTAVDSIRRKRDGLALTTAEIRSLVEGYVDGRIPDYQMSAFLMAVYFRGLCDREMTDLTMAMAHSGDMISFGDNPRIVDKHSTGGVGDKTSLVVVPLVAAAGVVVPKMSGRGLGHTGGTLDKLESIPGFRVFLSPEEFRRTVAEVGAAIVGQTGNLVPADKLLYALRDVTATVDSVGLIASSIMSKKIAGGAQRLVLDVKAGRGAFMPAPDRATELARAMTAIGKGVGLRVVAAVTSMDQPLGLAVGNALEVEEAIGCLKGEGPPDLQEEAVELGAHMLVLAGVEPDLPRARDRLTRTLSSGRGAEKFEQMVTAQGGDGRVVDDPRAVLPRAPVALEVTSAKAGWVRSIDALAVGHLTMRLGAGRQRKEDDIDPRVGVTLGAKVGDRLEQGALLGVVYAATDGDARAAARAFEKAFELASEPVPPPALFHGVVS
ncbi:MAG: thymidine phosphorylase [Bacillota bacterium]|nr:MAG: thymidine phosphorylase [Bacillota bacterium]